MDVETSARPVELSRSVGFVGLVLYGLGTTIGAGIYALTGVIAGRAGLQAPLAFGVASGLAAFSALSFAELSGRFPSAGGEAVYVREGFRSSRLSTAVGLLVALAGIVSAATVSAAFVGYLRDLIPVPEAVALLGAVVIVGGVAFWGVRESVIAASVMTLVEVAGLLLIVAFAGDHWQRVPALSSEMWPTLEGSTWLALGSASFLAFYGFLGFEDMVNVAEEVRSVRTTLPRAILAVLGLTAVLYAAVATIAVVVVPPAELAASSAPLALVFERCGGSPALLGGIALCAMLNGVLVQIVKSSRVLYGLASLESLPRAFARIHPRTRTPHVATGGVVALAAFFGLALPLEELAALTSGVTLLAFTITNLALVLVKRRDPAPVGVLCVPIWVPVVGAIVSVGLLTVEWLGR